MKKKIIKFTSIIIILITIFLPIINIFFTNDALAEDIHTKEFAQKSYDSVMDYSQERLMKMTWNHNSTDESYRMQTANFLCLERKKASSNFKFYTQAVIDINPDGSDPTYYKATYKTSKGIVTTEGYDKEWPLFIAYYCWASGNKAWSGGKWNFNGAFTKYAYDKHCFDKFGMNTFDDDGSESGKSTSVYKDATKYKGTLPNAKGYTLAARVILLSGGSMQDSGFLFAKPVPEQKVNMYKYIKGFQDLDFPAKSYDCKNERFGDDKEKAYWRSDDYKKAHPVEARNSNIRIQYAVAIINKGSKAINGVLEDVPEPGSSKKYLSNLQWINVSYDKKHASMIDTLKYTVNADNTVTIKNIAPYSTIFVRFSLECNPKLVERTIENQAIFTTDGKIIKSSDFIHIDCPEEKYEVKKFIYRVKEADPLIKKENMDENGVTNYPNNIRRDYSPEVKQNTAPKVITGQSEVYYVIRIENHGTMPIKGYLKDNYSNVVFTKSGYSWVRVPKVAKVIDGARNSKDKKTFVLKTEPFIIPEGMARVFKLKLTLRQDQALVGGLFENRAYFITSHSKKESSDWINIPPNEFDYDKYITRVDRFVGEVETGGVEINPEEWEEDLYGDEATDSEVETTTQGDGVDYDPSDTDYSDEPSSDDEQDLNKDNWDPNEDKAPDNLNEDNEPPSDTPPEPPGPTAEDEENAEKEAKLEKNYGLNETKKANPEKSVVSVRGDNGRVLGAGETAEVAGDVETSTELIWGPSEERAGLNNGQKVNSPVKVDEKNIKITYVVSIYNKGERKLVVSSLKDVYDTTFLKGLKWEVYPERDNVSSKK